MKFEDWKKHQADKPLTPDFSRPLPTTTRTEKRIARVVVQEIAKPTPEPVAKPEPSPEPEPKVSLQAKLVRWGWQTESGRSMQWYEHQKSKEWSYPHRLSDYD
jgi:hypothetical protein